MTSILPNQILPPNAPIAYVNGAPVVFEKNWWLLLYNFSNHILGTSDQTAAPETVQLLADVDSDAESSDLLFLTAHVSGLEKQQDSDYPQPQSIIDRLLALDPLLQDVRGQAQPVQIVTVGTSPFVYQALAEGTVLVSGGTVSAVALSRDGVTFYSLIGAVPVSRLDSVQVTFTVTPTMQFFPR